VGEPGAHSIAPRLPIVQFSPMSDFSARGYPEGPETPAQAGDFVAARDAVRLLQMMGTLTQARSDPRAWRVELLQRLCEILVAAAAAAFTLKGVNGDAAGLAVVSFLEAGFKSEAQQQAFMREFNEAPFHDPLSHACLERFTSERLSALTCLRSEVCGDEIWNANPHVQNYRRATGTGDCILSLHRGIERGTCHALMAFKPLSDEAAAAFVPGRPGPRFVPRDRLLLDTLHRGLESIYRSEEATQKLNRASGLTPRLRQTLELLLGGDTERQVAMKLSLSVHTVHDYVKALYVHFGVSSRSELLAKWMHTGGQLPKRPER
jgi:DNA-binding CsgD family transcriptional regulator